MKEQNRSKFRVRDWFWLAVFVVCILGLLYLSSAYTCLGGAKSAAIMSEGTSGW